MTEITINKTDGHYTGFIIEGHSGYADPGYDIVCASVSILSYTAINSLNIVAGIDENDIDYAIDEKTGYFKLDTKKYNDKSDVIYNSFLIGIRLLIEDYSDYITLKLKEV